MLFETRKQGGSEQIWRQKFLCCDWRNNIDPTKANLNSWIVKVQSTHENKSSTTWLDGHSLFRVFYSPPKVATPVSNYRICYCNIRRLLYILKHSIIIQFLFPRGRRPKIHRARHYNCVSVKFRHMEFLRNVYTTCEVRLSYITFANSKLSTCKINEFNSTD